MKKTLLLVVMALFFVGCASTAKTQNSGNFINIVSGASFEIFLPANPSTGYTWAVANETSLTSLILVETKIVRTDERVLGANQTQIFVFKAIKEGEQNLRFEYKRSWEVDTLPADVRFYTVLVK